MTADSEIRVSAVKCAGLDDWPSSVDINLANDAQV